jgi:hypothetical protein
MTPQPDLVFSLGPNCRNAWNLRSHFGVGRAYPFDWWITPARAMLHMIEPGFAFRVTADQLVITPVAEDGGNSIYNRDLNILHHHDFPRRANLVEEIRPDQVTVMNEKYARLFGRLRADVAAARAPLAILNGINGGWRTEPGGTARLDRRLNGKMEPQALVDGIRERLGRHVSVAILGAGPERFEQLEGGVLVNRPRRDEREPKGAAPSYAEPVHVFRACYQALGLAPAMAG